MIWLMEMDAKKTPVDWAKTPTREITNGKMLHKHIIKKYRHK